ncbi:hypothetical protein O7599_29360 [Streptomyces sp. WMMC500]|uniref:hypothetical protein n=1 Tax=Streptomyces sp. WMMC500 TaxID=3015154 RepID=UPI00248D2CCB|nr:hypothetical protein [Streptomyces sp. WMMC500]WBB59631.1 hypothetical protein O7599_29360 [Streptomyces sp. WMMC500]
MVKIIGVWTVVVAIFAAVFGVIWLATQPGSSSYAVAFSDDVDCDYPPDLIFSEDTGELMVCTVSPVARIVEDPDYGVFTEAEVDELMVVSKWLVRDGRVSHADKQEIEARACAIGARNENPCPKPRNDPTGTLAIGSLIGALILGLLYWLLHPDWVGLTERWWRPVR